MKNKVLMLCGILAPVVYVLTVILGGVLRPGYSHVSQAISDLMATGAPNKSLLDPLFALYNLLAIAFALGLFQHVRNDHQNRGKVVGTQGQSRVGEYKISNQNAGNIGTTTALNAGRSL